MYQVITSIIHNACKLRSILWRRYFTQWTLVESWCPFVIDSDNFHINLKLVCDHNTITHKRMIFWSTCSERNYSVVTCLIIRCLAIFIASNIKAFGIIYDPNYFSKLRNEYVSPSPLSRNTPHPQSDMKNSCQRLILIVSSEATSMWQTRHLITGPQLRTGGSAGGQW